MALNKKKAFRYGCLALVTAPVWVPFAFVGYIGAKMTRFAFRHATPVALALGAAGLITYGACQYREPIKVAATHALEHWREDAAAAAPASSAAGGLEQRISAPQPPVQTGSVDRPAVPILDEPNTAYYYVRQGETLARIAQRITGDPRDYREIARLNRIPDPQDVAVGTLLRIPDRLCAHATPGLYDTVPSLNSLVLPGTVTLTEMFGDRANEVMALNRELGIAYQDAFAYPHGERVVWIPDAMR